MNKNFHELQRQLDELSKTINKFESEAVQLRIVELLFEQMRGGQQFLEAPGAVYSAGPGRGRRRAEPTSAAVQRERPATERHPQGSAPSASGAVAALAKLVAGDFFKQKRSIGDVVKRCEEEYGTRYKSNAFSGPLSRYANSGTLKREKNAEGKYVYFK